MPACPGRDPRTSVDNPQLQARGFHEVVEHAVVGALPTPTVPFRYASVERWLRMPAPLLGEHNRDILQGLLIVDDDAYASLEARGIVGTKPKGA